MRTHTIVVIISMCLLGLLVWAADIGFADIVGDRELLRLVISAAEENRSKLITWCAEANITETSQAEKETVPKTRTDRVKFKFDRTKKACLTEELHMERIVQMPDGSRRTDKGEYITRTMLKGDTLYFLEVEQQHAQRVDMSAPSHLEVQAWGLLFPRVYFYDFRKLEIPDLFKVYYDGADKISFPLALRREGDLVIAEFGTKHAYNRYTCDLSKGGNLVAYDAQSERLPGKVPLSRRLRIEYAGKDGVFYPIHWRRETTGELVTGETIKRVRDVRFENSKVNAPLDDAAFTMESLGVRPGDLVVDNRANINYRYKAEGDTIGEPGFTGTATSRPATTRAASHTGTGDMNPIEGKPGVPDRGAMPGTTNFPVVGDLSHRPVWLPVWLRVLGVIGFITAGLLGATSLRRGTNAKGPGFAFNVNRAFR